MKILIKRVYDQPNPMDGLRILVDRLWPRGLSKEKAEIDVWLKYVAPSNDLRKWYQHNLQRWPEFKKKYFAELDKASAAVNELASYVKRSNVAFVYAAKDSDHNNAVALKEYINLILSK